MTNQELVKRAQSVLFQNYRTQPIALVRGEGSWVWDADGKRYLDFIGGIATVSVGHANVDVTVAQCIGEAAPAHSGTDDGGNSEGCEIAGALKNIMAIAAVSGLALRTVAWGANAQA